MPRVVLTHAVVDIDRWLEGKAERAAAIQSGSGPDIIMLFNNHPQIYSESVVDMSDLASSVGKAEDGYYDL